MNPAEYVHLHAHTEASIADGLFGPKKWIEGLKQKGFKAHAITDHGTMTSLLPFYSLMRKEKMIPILGVEFYYVDEPTVKNNENRKNSHMILLAKTYDGFRNLNKLMKLAYTDGYYYKPRIGREWLAKHSEDLICLTACQGGVLAQEVWHEHKGRDKGMGLVERFKDLHAIFGKDLYVEFQMHHTISLDDDGEEFDSQALINKGLATLKAQKGFQQIVTNDCHYILPKHANIQKLIKETSWKGGSKDGTSDSATVTKDHFTDSLWLKTPVDIYKSFLQHHEYLPKSFVLDGMQNSMEILEKCAGFELPSGKRYLPSYKPENKETAKDFFQNLTLSLLKKHLDSGILHKTKREYFERYKKELAVISKYNLEDYFLIVWDLIVFAKKNGIYVGLGRGSSAGCLISYLMGIVAIDPLQYGLIFERFLNENRCESGELPDIDLDFESDRRKEIKEYIFKKYGAEHVCEIGTYGRMKLKTAIIDFAKSLGIADHRELLNITTSIDLEKEDVDDLDKAIEADPRLEKLVSSSKIFEFTVKETIGQIKSQGIHPAGLVICSDIISEITPLKSQLKKIKPEDMDELNPEKEKRILVTQAEDKHIIAQGLMKMDILGLKEYDVIKYVIDNVKSDLTMENYVQKIMAQELAEPNKEVWKMFQQGKTEGVFQFASDGMKDLLVMMRPDKIQDLIAANALFRPGCLENGWHIQYCNRKKGEEVVEYVHEDVEAALGETYGVIVYQEQFMEVIHRLGNISLVESDIIRSALGKKDKEKLAKFTDRFVAGAKDKIGESQAKALWEQIEKASGYSFNKSHSAAYSVLAYISQYLKVNCPEQFWAAQLDWDTRKNKLDDMLVNKRAAGEMGVKMQLPDINDSKIRFSAKKGQVIWSLSSVKGVGYKAATEIEKKQPFSSFEDFTKRISKSLVKQNITQSLIYGGAFDKFGDRKSLIRDLNSKSKSKKPMVIPSEEDLINLFAKSMGFFERKIKTVREGKFSKYCITETELRDHMAGEYVTIGGMIQNVRKIKTKKGDDMAFLTIVDLDELIDVTIFPQMFREHREMMREGNIVQIGGTKSDYGGRENAVQADKIILC